jgi:hypothetical protein
MHKPRYREWEMTWPWLATAELTEMPDACEY